MKMKRLLVLVFCFAVAMGFHGLGLHLLLGTENLPWTLRATLLVSPLAGGAMGAIVGWIAWDILED
jgi:hypothetical protein